MLEDALVRTGKSGSLRDQPSELTESRNELFAMVQPMIFQLNGSRNVHGRVYRPDPSSTDDDPLNVCRDYARWSADDLRR